MSNMHRAAQFAALLCVFGSSTLWSQTVRPVVPRPSPRPRVEPCWQQVGISKSAMQERAAIGRETRAQVEAVCANASLTPQQRQQEIRQIRQQARSREEALVSPSQQQALRACQQERASAHPSFAGLHHGTGTGPCGEMATAAPT